MLTSCRPITKAGGLAAAGIGLGADRISDMQKGLLAGLVGGPWGQTGAIGRAGRGKMIPPALEKPLHGFIPGHPGTMIPRIGGTGVPVAEEVRKLTGMGRTIKIRLIVGNGVAEIVNIGGMRRQLPPGTRPDAGSWPAFHRIPGGSASASRSTSVSSGYNLLTSSGVRPKHALSLSA